MMMIKQIHVQHFRSIHDDVLQTDSLTALVGGNGAGKSSFLTSVEIFYGQHGPVEVHDFYDGDTSKPIRITITYDTLNSSIVANFSDYVDRGRIAITMVIGWSDGKPHARYHGSVMRNADVQQIIVALQLRDRGKRAQELLADLSKQKGFTDLPAYTTKDGTKTALLEWERNHPDQCERGEDDGTFFGFGSGFLGNLAPLSTLVYIPAVRDAAAEAEEGRSSVFTRLMDLVVRNALERKEEIQQFVTNIQADYSKLMEPSNHPELRELATDLSKSLSVFVPNAKVHVDWIAAAPFELPTPRASTTLTEDGYTTTVDRTGHGLQRAFVIALLRHLSDIQNTNPEDVEADDSASTNPNLVLAIEEPELYQHPNRQRYFAEILLRLASASVSDGAQRTQVLYTTHSPLFVGIDRFHQLRILRKYDSEDGPKMTKSVNVSLRDVAGTLQAAAENDRDTFTGDALRPRLTAVMTPWMNEGFFATVAVLVEGEDDRAAILGCAAELGHDLDSLGVSVIPCGGKTNIDKPAAIFTEFGIPTYLIWDSDKGKGDDKTQKASIEQNRFLLRLCGEEPEDWPAMCRPTAACFEVNLETAIRDEAGPEVFDKVLAAFQIEVRIPKKKYALKRPAFFRKLLSEMHKADAPMGTLGSIVDAIVDLASSEPDQRV